MNRWFLILVHACVALGITQSVWAQAPSPAAWLRSTSQTQIEGEERYDVTLSWQQGVIDAQQPASDRYTVYRAPIGQNRELDAFDQVGSVDVDQSQPNITFVDEGVMRGAYFYFVVGQAGTAIGAPSPRVMVFAPGSYCVNLLDPVLTFVTSPKTVIEPGEDYEYMAFARHRSARVQGFVRYELATGPDGMSIDELTGTVTWTVPADFSGPVAVKIRAWSLDDENAEAFQEWGLRAAEPFEILIGSTSSVSEAQLLSSGIAPNPASTSLALHLASAQRATIRVVDVTGQVVLEQIGETGGEVVVSVDALAPGRYTVVVEQGRAVQTSPLVVVR